MCACFRALAWVRAVFPLLLILAGSTWLAPTGHAATGSYTTSFSFAHTGQVSSGTVAVLGTFTNTTVAASPALSLPQFDPALGRLSQATIVVTTSTATFVISPTGVLSLVSSGSATRNLRYTVTAGATSATGSNELVSSGSTLLTLLGVGGGEIGGAPLANSSAFTSFTDLNRFTGTGSVSVTLTASNTLVVSTVLSLFDGAGLRGAGTYAGTVSVTYDYTPWALSGSVYNDADHNGFKSAAEAGTGLTLYAKLLASPSGPVLQTTPVDPASGVFTFAVARGNYRVLIDDNTSTADITPLQPPIGWSATQANGLASDVLVSAGLPSQDFGLVAATLATGRLFMDTGAGAGVANDGIQNGAEAGLAGRGVRLLDNSGAVLDATVSGQDGSFRLYVPLAVASGATLRIQQADDGVLVPTGATLGTTAGAYSRATRTLSFVFSNTAPTTGVALGFVGTPSLTAWQQQSGTPGAVVFFLHTYVATTAGKVTFTTTHPVPPAVAWSEVLYLDANGNGRIDPGEGAATAPVDVVAGQTVALILKLSVPEAAPGNQRLETTLKADLALSNAAPALTLALQVIDLTLVLPNDGTQLVLVTTVSTTVASPGSTVVYTLTFSNPGASAVRNLTITGTTPTYTSFVSAAAAALPPSLTVGTTTTPSVGAGGALRWMFAGELLPGSSGSLSYTVRIEP